MSKRINERTRKVSEGGTIDVRDGDEDEKKNLLRRKNIGPMAIRMIFFCFYYHDE